MDRSVFLAHIADDGREQTVIDHLWMALHIAALHLPRILAAKTSASW